jgi:uncharacterized protein
MNNRFFFNKNSSIRSIWWVPFFLLVLALILFPIIFIAQKKSTSVSMPIQVLLIIIVTIVCQLLRQKPFTEITGKIDLTWISHFLAGSLIGIGLMVLPAFVLSLMGYIHWQVNDLGFSTILNGLSLFAFVALAEELLFRGFIFQRLIESLGIWPSQFIIACFFLLTHINNPGMEGTTKILASCNIFIASIMFGLAFIKTKSLAMPLGLHLMANFTQGVFLGFGVSGEKGKSIFLPISENCPTWINGGDFGLEASIFGLITVVIITLFLLRWKNPDLH